MSNQDDRPYFTTYIFELQKIVSQNWNNCSVLFEVLAELDYRRPRKKPKELRENILNRLRDLHDDYFPWPTTLAYSGDGQLEAEGWPEKGLLSYIGYRVGKTGRSTEERRSILDGAYIEELPTVNNGIYMAKWGSPQSSTRLRKIANSLAAFCKNFKKTDNPKYFKAINDWEVDLTYLKKKYYNNVYDFRWPQT